MLEGRAPIFEKVEKFKQQRALEEVRKLNEQSKKEGIIMLKIINLIPFKNQPFKAYSEDEMKNLKESIERIGLQVPIIVRPISEEKYEILSGHNRVEAYKELGYDEISCKIVNVDDDIAQMIMIDTNIVQRESLSPMERARAYKLKQEIKERKGFIDKETEDVLTDDEKEKLEDIETSERTYFRYLSLNNLIPEFQNRCDAGELSIKAGELLSKINEENQRKILVTLGEANITEKKAAELKETCENESELTEDLIKKGKGNSKEEGLKTSIKFSKKELKKYFSDCLTYDEQKGKILKLLESTINTDLEG